MAWKKFSISLSKKVGIAGDLMNPLNVREAGLLIVIEGCTAEQLKLGGGLCPLVIGGRVQKLRPDQQRPLRAPHQRGQVIRTEWGQVLRSTWCWCCTSSSTACTRGRSPPPLRPTVILVAGAGQLATTSQLSLSKSPSGPILCFPKFDEGLVRLLLNARPAGDRRPDLSRQAEGGHDTVQLEAWTLAPYPDSSQQRAVVVLVRQGGVPVPCLGRGWEAAARRWSWWTQVRDPDVITPMFQEAEYEENRNKSLVTRRT